MPPTTLFTVFEAVELAVTTCSETTSFDTVISIYDASPEFGDANLLATSRGDHYGA